MFSFYCGISFVLLIFEAYSIPVPERVGVGTKSVVHVISHRISKRSLENPKFAGYDIKLKAFDTVHHLKLRSTGESLFSDDFKYHEVDVDSDGNTIHMERTPTKRDIHQIEQHIYVDSDANAVLKIRSIDGDLHLDGILNNIRISRDADNETNEAVVIEELPYDGTNRSKSDYVDLQRPLATPRGLSSGRISVSPEVAFVFDYDNGKTFNFDNVKITDYLAIMLNSVNNRYATLDDPKITFKLSGVYTIKSPGGQPFVEQSRVAGNKIKIDTLLDLYKVWVRQNLNLFPKHDLIPLLYGGEPASNFVGLAFINGACWVNPQSVMATSVSQDAGASWRGAMTLTHELGHSLGAPHDGDDKSSGCPWAQGYIMSYEGYGKLNKFTFSSCSASAMKSFIQSSGGYCLNVQDNKNQLKPVSSNVGERLTMDQMCQKRTGYSNATVRSDDGNQQCVELACKVVFKSQVGTRVKVRQQYSTFGELPGDNSPCGKGKGKCLNGKCIG